MSMLSLQVVKQVTGTGADNQNIISVLTSLKQYGGVEEVQLLRPHRTSHYIAQLAHESGRFIYDEEVWGPTAAQRRYEDRADLGHSPSIPGEAFRFRGRSEIQLTGRYNYQKFTKWVWGNVNSEAPDFERFPDLINTDPWEGLVPIWYWTVGNPTSKSLNVYADRNDIEMITKRINGGLNGYQDRINLYTRTSLVLLGYHMERGVIARYQRDHGLKVDDISGPETRQSLHRELVELPVLQISLDPKLVIHDPVDKPINDSEQEEERRKTVPTVPTQPKPTSLLGWIVWILRWIFSGPSK